MYHESPCRIKLPKKFARRGAHNAYIHQKRVLKVGGKQLFSGKGEKIYKLNSYSCRSRVPSEMYSFPSNGTNPSKLIVRKSILIFKSFLCW